MLMISCLVVCAFVIGAVAGAWFCSQEMEFLRFDAEQAWKQNAELRSENEILSRRLMRRGERVEL